MLVAHALVGSSEEASAILACVDDETCLWTTLQEYLSPEDAEIIRKKLIEEDSDDDAGAIESAVEAMSDVDDESIEERLEMGECELCERYIRLTRHHLIPKSTWSRIEPKLLQLAPVTDREDWPELTVAPDRRSIRAVVRQTCQICRPCHSMVHKTHSNMELATTYYTVDRLLADERILKFAMWASKQRTGKYTR